MSKYDWIIFFGLLEIMLSIFPNSLLLRIIIFVNGIVLTIAGIKLDMNEGYRK